MQANDIDNDSERLSDVRGGDVPGFGNAVVHELSRIRAEALRDIDERGFSCVTSLSFSSPSMPPVHRHGVLKPVSS